MITVDSKSLCSSSIHPSEESFAQSTIPIDSMSHPGKHKVLGIRWDLERDHLVFDLAHLLEKAEILQPTKRNVVSLIGQMYDPFRGISRILGMGCLS